MSSIATATVDSTRIPKGRLLIWLVVAGEIVIFGGGVVAYLLNRFRYLDIYDQLASLTSTPLGALNTTVLLTSSFLIVMAHHYAANKNLKKMQLSLAGTVALGAVFLVIKSLEWIPKIKSGIVLGIDDPKILEWTGPGTTFWHYYYFLTGMHAAHIVLGMIAIIIIMVNVRKGENLHRVELMGIYWHFVDIVWIFLFPLFYLSR